jgi:hypothetical protein
MENETVIVSSQAPVQPSSIPPAFKPKSPPKLLYLFGGLAVILVSIAMAVAFFGSSNSSNTTTNITSNSDLATDPTWPKYSNPANYYEIAVSPKWTEIKRSPLHSDTVLFDLSGNGILEINAQKTTMTLDEYLLDFDSKSKDLIKSKSSSQIKVGSYDGYERAESWPTTGLQVTTSYIKVADMLYIFTLTPPSGKNAVVNETVIREYHSALASFRLTDTTKLGVDLKEYSSKKIEALSFKAFSFKYPQSWVVTENLADNSLDVSIYRNNYEITISQKSIGGAVCLFSDSPAFEGSSGDLRTKQFTQFDTTGGATLRRYFNANAGDKSSMFFCQKQTDGPYFETPLSIGGLVYYVPAKYDADIIKEMDDIVKSISPLQ